MEGDTHALQQHLFIHRSEQRSFSVGGGIPLTAPANDLKVANRELGRVENITDDGRMSLNMGGGKSINLDPKAHPHLDQGYAVTSHSSQGQTADRVLIHVEPSSPPEKLGGHELNP